jgi:hypothetical protein
MNRFDIFLECDLLSRGRLPPLSRPKFMRFKVESVLKKTSFYPFKTEGAKPPRELICTHGFEAAPRENFFRQV